MLRTQNDPNTSLFSVEKNGNVGNGLYSVARLFLIPLQEAGK